MILADSRTGSGELVPLFKSYGIKVEATKLEFGDFTWEGWGPKGKCNVVVERKRIEDLIDSMLSNRLSGHQLPGMAAMYDYGYLLIEGIWRSNDEGFLEISNGGNNWRQTKYTTRAINNYSLGLTFRAGLISWKTATPKDTVSFIVDQYRMWTDKKWEEHTAHEAVYAPAEQTGAFGLSFIRREISLAEKLALQLPGVDRMARFVAKQFPTMAAMVAAKEKDWCEVPCKTKTGKIRRLGPENARKIYLALHGKSDQ